MHVVLFGLKYLKVISNIFPVPTVQSQGLFVFIFVLNFSESVHCNLAICSAFNNTLAHKSSSGYFEVNHQLKFMQLPIKVRYLQPLILLSRCHTRIATYLKSF